MAIIHDPRLPQSEHHSFNVLGTKAVLSFAAKHGVRKVIVLSSTNIYGPSPDNDNFLTEDSPLLGSQRFADIRDLIEVDMFAQQFMWKEPEVETVILRPVHIVGRTSRTRRATICACRGRGWRIDPMVQLIHEDDLALAMQLRSSRARAGSTTSSGRASCRSRRCCGSSSARDPGAALPRQAALAAAGPRG